VGLNGEETIIGAPTQRALASGQRLEMATSMAVNDDVDDDALANWRALFRLAFRREKCG